MSKILGTRYQLGEMIGTGGMADVYIGQDLRLSRKVAIKILRSDLAKDPSFIARFRKEALAAAGLNHPGIVAVYDSGEEEGNSYIVMELVNGQTLRELIHSGDPISLDHSLEIISGVLAALAYSHANGIIHRDIKPGNIMLTDDGDVKVMDFGIARALDDIGATMTNTWNVIGTAQYLSPEQATGETADRRSDIYSVGCLLYELLTGRPPFIGDTPVSIAYQHVSSVFQKPSEIDPLIDSNLDTVLSVALAKDPNNRYQSAGEMLSDIQRVIQGKEVTTKIYQKKKPKKRVITAVAAVVLLLIGTFYGLAARPKAVPFLQVPNVVGLTLEQATPLLVAFTTNIAHAPDGHIPKDRIASQLPAASSKVPKGSSISITISDGPGNTVVPVGLVGMSLADARNSLTSVGLVISRSIPKDSNEQPGTVLKVIPDVGSTVVAGSGVILEVASGSVQVPSLVGVDEIQAKTILVQAGFLVREVDATDAAQAANRVLAQAPDAGTSQTIGSTVTITINRISLPTESPTPIPTESPTSTPSQ